MAASRAIGAGGRVLRPRKLAAHGTCARSQNVPSRRLIILESLAECFSRGARALASVTRADVPHTAAQRCAARGAVGNSLFATAPLRRA
jgi:hypothetical protein